MDLDESSMECVRSPCVSRAAWGIHRLCFDEQHKTGKEVRLKLFFFFSSHKTKTGFCSDIAIFCSFPDHQSSKMAVALQIP